MKKFIPLLYALSGIVLLITLVSSSGGRAAAADDGNTGAPGETNPTCVTCHAPQQMMVQTKIEMFTLEGDITNSYIPGDEYTLRVTVDHVSGPAPSARGFQLLGLDLNNNDIAGFFNPDDNTQISTTSEERQYAEHKGPNSNSDFFETSWMAPMEGSGSVIFYAGAVGVNLNGSTTGDASDLSEIRINADSTTAVSDLGMIKIITYPNPFTNYIVLEFPGSEDFHVSLIDVNGIEIISKQYSHSDQLNMDDLSSGTYFLRITDKQQNQINRKIIKL